MKLETPVWSALSRKVVLSAVGAVLLSTAAVRATVYDTAVNGMNPIAYYQYDAAGSAAPTQATGTNAITPLALTAMSIGSLTLNNTVSAFGTASTFDATHGYTGFGTTNNTATFSGTTIASVLDSGDSTAGVTNAAALRGKLNGATSVTVSTWFTPGAAQTSTTAALASFLEGSNTSNVGAASAYQLNYTTTGIRIGGRSTTGDAFLGSTYTYAFTAGQLYNVVGVLDYTNKLVKAYVNGTLIGSSSAAFAASALALGTGGTVDNSGNMAGEFSVGALYNGFNGSTGTTAAVTTYSTGFATAPGATNSQAFIGQIDATSLYNTSFSDAQIAAMYAAAGVTPEPASLALLGLAGVAVLRRRAR